MIQRNAHGGLTATPSDIGVIGIGPKALWPLSFVYEGRTYFRNMQHHFCGRPAGFTYASVDLHQVLVLDPEAVR